MENDGRPFCLLSWKFHDEVVGQFCWRKRIMRKAGARSHATAGYYTFENLLNSMF